MTISSISLKNKSEIAVFNAVDDENNSKFKELITSKSVDLNCRNFCGDPLIVYLAKKNFFIGLKMLLESYSLEVDLNVKDKGGDTALHAAARIESIAMVHWLLEKGAHRNIRNSHGDSILHLASRSEDGVLMQYLLHEAPPPRKGQCVFNLNAVNQGGQTPLLSAGYAANKAAIRLLLEAGARANIRDKKGWTLEGLVVFLGIRVDTPLFMKKGDHYETEFVRRKMLALVNDLGGESCVGSLRFQLSGSFSFYMHHSFSVKLENFFSFENRTLSRFHKRILLNAFLGVSRSSKEIAQAIQKRSLVILPTGWEGHAINLAFYRGFMAICNGGETISRTTRTIELFPINPNEVNEKVVSQIRFKRKEKAVEAMSYFYKKLPQQLGQGAFLNSYDSLKKELMQIAPKTIRSGSCGYAAITTSLHTSIFLLKAMEVGSQHHRSVALLSKREAESIGRFISLSELQSYLGAYSSPEEARQRGDLPLARRAFEETRSSVIKEKNYHFLFNTALKDIINDSRRLQLFENSLVD